MRGVHAGRHFLLSTAKVQYSVVENKLIEILLNRLLSKKTSPTGAKPGERKRATPALGVGSIRGANMLGCCALGFLVSGQVWGVGLNA